MLGDYRNYTYDNSGQLKTAKGKESGGTTNRIQEQLGYAYDAAGNLNWRTNNALVQAFNVNNLNELTTATNTGTLTVAGTTSGAATNVTVNTSNATLYLDNTFARDGFTVTNGNNTYKAIAKDSYGRTDTNSITVSLPATNTYAYDLNGNLTSDGTRGFDYDDENQLVRVTVTNGWKSEFTYDGKMRRRIRKEYTWQSSAWLQTNEVRYVYVGNLVIQERDANNLPAVSYTRGRDLSGTMEGAGGIGGLLAYSQHSTINPQHSYYHADGNGNITALINAQQLVVAKYVFDSFGNILSMSGPLADANLYRFSSKEYSPSSGLVYYLYRFYEPNFQRWVNVDPIGELGGYNLHRFVVNDPVQKFDRFGEITFVGGAGLGSAAGAITTAFNSWISGNSFKQGACKSAIGCGVGAIFGGLAATFPPAAKCLAGAGSAISSALGKFICDTKCSETPQNYGTGCALFGAAVNAAVGCLFQLVSPSLDKSPTLDYLVHQTLSSLLGNVATGGCNFVENPPLYR